MALTPGARLGPYEVLSPAGAGGMGEVWKARDTRLDRSVAIKVLPAEFANNAQLKLRFEREAKSISQLNHPHICTLYDVGNQDGVEYLVLEYIEGETLADRLNKGPLPLDQVIRYGIEIAEALEKAHKAGIVHRDLKPGNVMLTKSGAKLLDFGLAKSGGGIVSGASNVTPEDATVAAMTGGRRTADGGPLTAEGTIIGTFQYMAPEQIEGKEADPRTDIFALGALLYEMATGKHAFEGKSKASLIASILATDPQPVSAVQPASPAALDRIIRTCLKKEPDDRLQSAHDVALELRWIAERGPEAAAAPRKRSLVPWVIAAGLAIALAALAARVLWFRPAPRAIQSEIVPPPYLYTFSPQISPDGTRLAFGAVDSAQKSHVLVRDLETGAAHEIDGTEASHGAIWTPDSRYLLFYARGALHRVPAGGGPVLDILRLPANPAGGTINRDGVMLFGTGPGILLVDQGVPRLITRRRADEASHTFPCFLPDGRHFLYLSRLAGREAPAYVRAAALDGSADKVLTRADGNAMFSSGYLLYFLGGDLVAQKFDPKKLKLEGDPSVVAGSFRASPGLYSVSDNGILVCGTPRNRAFGTTQLTWFNVAGKAVDTVAPPDLFWDPVLSPDGRRLAVRIGKVNGPGHLWIYDTDRKLPTRFSAGDDDETAPRWSADGRSLYYTLIKDKQFALCRRAVAGGAAVILAKSADRLFMTSISNDEKTALVQSQKTVQSPWSTFLLSLFDGRQTPFGDGRFEIAGAKFSPDGRWVAYAENDSDQWDIYVQRLADGSGKTRISTNGGDTLQWTPDGKKIYYHALDDSLMEVDLHLDTGAEPSTPQKVFDARVRPGAIEQFLVNGDGSRILANVITGDDHPPFTLIQNWTARIKP